MIIAIIIIIYSFESFSHQSLRDSKFSQVSRTLLSIMADLNNAVVWMVSTCPLISKSSCPFTYPLELLLSFIYQFDFLNLIYQFIFIDLSNR